MLYGLQAVPEALVFRLEFVGKHHDMAQGNFAAACCKIDSGAEHGKKYSYPRKL